MSDPEPTQLPAEQPESEGKGRGHDPDKKIGRERAEEVHQRNEQREKMKDSELPEKPDEEELPEEGDVSEDELDEIQQAGEEDVDFLDEDKAREDPTIDDQEQEEQPNQDLPKGARTEDYEVKDRLKERDDSEEEVP